MPKPIYFAPKQLAFLKAKQKTTKFLGGRGSGKSTCIAGKTRLRLSYLPRAKTFFASTSYNQILTKTLPAVESKFADFGLKEHIHYIIGRKPPKNWPLPYSPPRRYENVISFLNGYCIEFLSLDRPDLARGGSYDGGDIDEDQNLAQKPVTRVLLPSVRGNLHRFSHWMHHQINFYGSMPWLTKANWVLEYEEKAKAFMEEYFFIEASAEDNRHILGDAWFKRMERELPYHEYLVEILNQRITRIPDGFYPKFTDTKHVYVPIYGYGYGQKGITTEGPLDVRKGELLEVSFDFSGWFNCASIFQEHNNEEKLLRQFHVKDDDKINELVDKICNHFANHDFKFIRIWGEPRGHDKNPLGQSIYQTIKARFHANKWDCQIAVPAGYQAMEHIRRYQMMDDILSEENPNYPKFRVNQDYCKDIIIAVQTTPIKPDFKKDKNKEKDRNFPQEHAPHYTDTIDNYFDQKHGWKFNAMGGRSGGRVDFF